MTPSLTPRSSPRRTRSRVCRNVSSWALQRQDVVLPCEWLLAFPSWLLASSAEEGELGSFIPALPSSRPLRCFRANDRSSSRPPSRPGRSVCRLRWTWTCNDPAFSLRSSPTITTIITIRQHPTALVPNALTPFALHITFCRHNCMNRMMYLSTECPRRCIYPLASLTLDGCTFSDIALDCHLDARCRLSYGRVADGADGESCRVDTPGSRPGRRDRHAGRSRHAHWRTRH